MSKLKLLISLIIFSLSANAKGEIIETHNIAEIKKIFSDLSEGDLALFDVKDVIFQPKDKVMSQMHKIFFDHQFNLIKKKYDKSNADYLKSIVLASYESVLVEDEMPKIITDIQKTGAMVFALTSGKTGAYGVIKNREDLRIQTLKNFGINFTKLLSFPEIDFSKEHNIFFKKENGKPIFKNGVIFAARLPKDKVLGYFLNSAKLKPKKLIFIDNQLKNVKLVANKCCEFGIKYTGIYFNKSSSVKHESLNEKIAKKKFEILVMKRKWISDAEAKKLLLR